MKKILFALFSVALSNAVFAQKNELALIPEPVSVVQGSGSFVLTASTRILHAPPSLDTMSKMLALRLKQSTGYNITTGLYTQNQSGRNIISLQLTQDAAIPKEGYLLDVTTNNVVLKARDASGIFYGIQTLLQLLPKEIESASVTTAKWEIPVVKISDHPRFGWRGLMLDCSRHFFTKEEVKKFIDQMSRYKFNVLHWHLTDDQGWRIEIKSLPKLTEVGAWRVNKTGRFGTFTPPTADEPRDYGGFYTQADIREIVQYAKSRQIDILPEIDVPGHSMAAIASYPELTCTPGNYVVNSGEQFMIWPSGGHFYGTQDNSLCPANEKVYEFMDKVFTEVAQLFPFEYIHMGGDETARNFWEKSDAIKALMQKEKLANLDEVQSYFVKRMEKIINAKGKKMIGWDEILQGGLAPNA
ncbi:MAG: beta-N-acetylhexosaminidase, partial [Chitinophagaceae bacterium]|nr:beta-N-acetylhexosaminidase [Chitinophagaceae bacterium]